MKRTSKKEDVLRGLGEGVSRRSGLELQGLIQQVRDWAYFQSTYYILSFPLIYLKPSGPVTSFYVTDV